MTIAFINYSYSRGCRRNYGVSKPALPGGYPQFAFQRP